MVLAHEDFAGTADTGVNSITTGNIHSQIFKICVDFMPVLVTVRAEILFCIMLFINYTQQGGAHTYLAAGGSGVLSSKSRFNFETERTVFFYSQHEQR